MAVELPTEAEDEKIGSLLEKSIAVIELRPVKVDGLRRVPEAWLTVELIVPKTDVLEVSLIIVELTAPKSDVETIGWVLEAPAIV